MHHNALIMLETPLLSPARCLQALCIICTVHALRVSILEYRTGDHCPR